MSGQVKIASTKESRAWMGSYQVEPTRRHPPPTPPRDERTDGALEALKEQQKRIEGVLAAIQAKLAALTPAAPTPAPTPAPVKHRPIAFDLVKDAEQRTTRIIPIYDESE